MEVARARSLVRATCSRFFCSMSSHQNHQMSHKFIEPNSFIGSWEAPKDPKEAEKKLALLRRQYKKQVKAVCRDYIQEMELMRIEKQKKEDARKEALRVANEERRKLKAEVAKVRAQERKIAEEEFRQTLLKERAEKLEYWRMRERKVEEKKAANKENLRRESSMWIDEKDLEKHIMNVVIDTKFL